ncbi:hypothetical protein SO802_021687 [Lithocarpus litseifolius]|uniref:Transmembrane protein n=1 Tax=Lithocarpus litseifolius TaxID=425828 RepID=A0AAW2CGW3_9ROSI
MEDFSKNCQFVVGLENRVRFWQDGWNGDQPLQLAFPRLYGIAINKEVSVEASLSRLDFWVAVVAVVGGWVVVVVVVAVVVGWVVVVAVVVGLWDDDDDDDDGDGDVHSHVMWIYHLVRV